MLEKEIERAGIPAVLITALVPTAQTLRANRIVPGIGITNPLGDPNLTREEEKTLRKKIVLDALKTLAAKPGKAKNLQQGDVT
ncbi:MAG: selenoprotein glycine/betaine/sarcosine/D-proline reductase family [Deltaproteobacteria bacterium]|nr:selenoprotein glycine/betaine/sarcosine/D-proline reductase family [Deltaproteobacteria bacterium]